MKLDIAHAWKDEVYRENLSEEQLAQLPECPVGAIDLGDDDLDSVLGAIHTNTFMCSTTYNQRTPFARLQTLPTNGRPIVASNWKSLDEAFLDVAEGIRRAA
ncbi:MAG: mersacidin/lichenicidin family type 2 lantibiotic [Ktedonobacteraceae bacterium]|nr:mersacidin/lichenicidin family type 2 lantibiotic [Ktedonobacteraceae bacterium]